MNGKAGIIGTILLALVPWGAGATETGTMICKGGIVSIGDAIPEVLQKCGPPAFSSQREQVEVGGSVKPGVSRTYVKVTVDDWTYNFGPNEFMYRVIFENGNVARIESLEWGY
ncbi:DUF2845 domain-containing protein [Geobacter hydrogenophilus]|uniref:DUF2845 domain-containing protein n=1 Tax=Geobacter hydrogenophilus TaxID=40983 RepID=A0A9W6FY48_9BACT|nr:DUF2845 domain-containing protein [Geobacter hydrogenophilus]MBT0895098.1 DUF2845 domain-containing protein [Geobacter hydrogenophilus]GLI36923.1 hypothetical protein GHYDROH2_04240 [Geobacter hydrogenophilus]